jgi:hypothetical protein
MLLVNVMIPLVYAGANVLMADCLLFFGQNVFNEHVVLHWCGRKYVLVCIT